MNRNAVSNAITTAKMPNLINVLRPRAHPGIPICGVLRGGPSIGPEQPVA